MKIRSITLFANPGQSLTEDFLEYAGVFASRARELGQDHQVEIQTIRFASPPFPTFLEGQTGDQIIRFAIQLEKSLNALAFDYISLGPAIPGVPESFNHVRDIIQNTSNTFCSGLLTEKGSGISLDAVKACGTIIEDLASVSPDGFANLYFAALGNVPPGSPFFPAAYHQTGEPEFGFAIEGADLAVNAFAGSDSSDEARSQLIAALEKLDKTLNILGSELEEISGAAFSGSDYSLAPYPGNDSSLGGALEHLGISKVGEHGSLAAAAFLADTIDQADLKRTGFSGLMLPVLEDSILADRAAEGTLTIKDLLLYSAVCGTGLDTIPLPGNAKAGQISAVLLDLAALSLRLDKPLTARLMPIPGKNAGDKTDFDFEYFANSKVMALEAGIKSDLLDGTGFIDLQPRNHPG